MIVQAGGDRRIVTGEIRRTGQMIDFIPPSALMPAAPTSATDTPDSLKGTGF